MDLDQEIQLINSKHKNVSPKDRDKWRIPELPPFAKAGVLTSAKSLDRHNEFISSSEEFHAPRKDRGPSEGLETHVLQRTSPTDEILSKKPKNFPRGPKKEVGPKKEQQPCGSYSSLHKQGSASKSAKKGQQSPKEKSEGQEKGKGKGKIQVEQALPTELHNSKEKKTAMDNVFNMARTLMEFKKKEEQRMNQSFPMK
ncbi:hypothetical protein O181_055858 [Austropuccinia psidii MF-1]|uniref:Uncharacterized protein n=1 Tax=Austropuccinia psidii MF-1 TaxID=1389203 RepID=A0A9Q3HSW7_9BASI|nr:hypothetical protein [Austropuccinia psidii MF-1]